MASAYDELLDNYHEVEVGRRGMASSRPSSWARLSALSKGSTRVYVLSCARPRAELTSRTIRSGAGKTSLSVRNRSRARRKRTFGASCSRARSSPPSFEFFQVP